MQTKSALAVAAAVALSAGLAPAGEPTVKAGPDASKPFLVKIHADWCGTCVRLGPTFEKLEEEVGAKARIIVLDVTDRDTSRVAYMEAKRLGILDFYEANKSKTGTVGILRGDNREVVQVLKGETKIQPYQAALAEARKTS